MEALWHLFLVALGILLLYLGGEALVSGAVALARAWGVAPAVVGLTVVAFGTSSPELAASLAAALSGSPGIALGNVVGSNILNILLILGLAALLAPLRAQARFLRQEVPFMLLATLLLFPALWTGGGISRLEGLLFTALLLGYIGFLYRATGGAEAEVREEFAREFGGRSKGGPRDYALLLLGLLLLALGARVLTEGAVALARGLGVPELVIGLTLVALGTSLPEVAASLVAALKGEADIALGNIVGSNIFNILGILGLTALVQPLAFPLTAIARDLGAMLLASLLLWPFLRTGGGLGRGEGAAFLLLYLLYLGLLARDLGG